MLSDVFVTLSVLSFIVESITEYVFSKFVHKKYVAVAIGILVAVAFEVNLFAYFIERATRANPIGWWTGLVLSGVLCGRGGNIFHDIKTRLVPSMQERLLFETMRGEK